MILIKDKLIYPTFVKQNCVFLFTSNSIVKKDGTLVMGAGSAKDFKEVYTKAPKYFGGVVKDFPTIPVHLVRRDEGLVGSFKTKNHWKEPSTLEIVKTSVKMLKLHAETHPEWSIYLPFPGIGFGGLDIESVLPLLEELPDNVFVFLMGE